MDVYEFILIPTSIIVGLGVAELFGGVVRVLRGELKAGLFHSLWVTLVFVLQVQWLWASWELVDRSAWLFPEFIVFMIGPIGLYMAAAMLFPANAPKGNLDQYFLDRRRPFFLILILTIFSYSLSGWFVVNDPVGYQDLGRLIFISGLVALLIIKNRTVHLVGSVAWLGTLIVFISFFTLRVG